MIRSMESGDKDPVIILIKATDMFTPEEVIVAEEIIDTYLNQSHQKDYDIVVVENAERRVAGYLSYGPTALTDGTYDLYWMAISPRDQGKGYGKKLVEWLERKIKESHGRMIIIETSSQPKYHPTRQFYLGLGYKEVARIPDFYKSGDDRIIYTKYI